MGATVAVGAAPGKTTVAVPSAMVHKLKAENVWIDGAETLADGSVRFGYRVPATEPKIRLADLIEIERQAGIYYVHDRLGIPKDHVFVLSSIAIRRSGPQQPAVTTGVVTVQQVNEPSQAPRRLNVQLAFSLTSRAHSATGDAQVRFISAAAYERMRSSKAKPAPPGVSPNRRNATIGHEGLYVGTVDSDPNDPVLSDHDADHISAMTVIVSVERGLMELGASRVEAISVEFRSYMELGVQTTFALALTSDGIFSGTVRQGDAACATFAGQVMLPGTVVLP